MLIHWLTSLWIIVVWHKKVNGDTQEQQSKTLQIQLGRWLNAIHILTTTASILPYLASWSACEHLSPTDIVDIPKHAHNKDEFAHNANRNQFAPACICYTVHVPMHHNRRLGVRPQNKNHQEAGIRILRSDVPLKIYMTKGGLAWILYTL